MLSFESHGLPSYKRKLTYLLIVFLSVVIICGSVEKPHAAPRRLVLGVVVALTGEAADWGQTELNAVKLAVSDVEASGAIQKGAIQLDVQNAPDENVGAAVTAYRRTVALGRPYAIIGPTWDDAAAAIAPISTELKMVTIAPDASSGVQKGHTYPYYFSTFAPEAPEMAVLARYLAHTGARRAAIVCNQDPFSQEFHDAFAAAAKKAGLTIVGDFPIADPDARDFRGIIARLAATSPDVVFIEMTSQGAKGPFMRQARAQGLKARVVSSSTTDTASLLNEYGTVLDGLTFAAPINTAARRKLLVQYKAAYGRLPSAPSAPSAYDDARILIAAYQAHVASGAPLRDYLLSLKHINGVSARGMHFAPDGRIIWPETTYEMWEIENGKIHAITTP